MKPSLPLTLLLTTSLITGLSTPTPALAENNTVKFSCGSAKDPSSRQELPATVASVAGNSERTVIVVWKSEFFGTKYPPQKRCLTASTAFQKAFQAGRYHLGSGVDKKTGLGIICAIAKPAQDCNKTNMLLTMKTYQDADETINQLGLILEGKTGMPVYQGSNGKRVNLRNLATKR